MSRSRPFRAFVQKNLAGLLGAPRIQADEEGDYCFGYGPIQIVVRVSEDLGFVGLEFLALLLQKPTHPGRVASALNQMNGARIAARVFREGQDIVAAWVVPLETMDGRQFKQLCETFCEAADEIGEHLRRRVGGRPPNPGARHATEEPVDV